MINGVGRWRNGRLGTMARLRSIGAHGAQARGRDERWLEIPSTAEMMWHDARARARRAFARFGDTCKVQEALQLVSDVTCFGEVQGCLKGTSM